MSVAGWLGLILLLASCAEQGSFRDAPEAEQAEAIDTVRAFEDAFFEQDFDEARRHLTPDFPGCANDIDTELDEIWEVTFSRFSSMQRVGTPRIVEDAIKVSLEGVSRDGLLRAQGHHLLSMHRVNGRWLIDNIRVTFTRYDSIEDG